MAVLPATPRPFRDLPPFASELRLLFLLSSSLACTDPHFENTSRCDASVCIQGLHDAAANVATHADAGPDLRAQLVGRYAVRIRFFSRNPDAGSQLEHEIIMLASVTQDPSRRIFMETQRCRDEGSTNLALTKQTFRWAHPEHLPREHFELTLRDGTFRSEAAPRAIGYSESQPAGCTPGAAIPASSEQTWLTSGQCDCLSDPLPMVVSDCRVSDPDGDGHPGLTVIQTGLYTGDVYVRTQDACQIVDGTVAADGRHTAHYVENYDFFQMQCTNTTGCVQGNVEGCPSQVNPVVFEPLPSTTPDGKPWDCSAVLQQNQAGRLFSSEALSFPKDC